MMVLPDPAVLPAFLAAMVLVELTPGPNMAYLAVLSASRGMRAGASAVGGVTLGLSVYMLATVLGLAELLLQIPLALRVLHWAGVLYLLWLAIEAWRGAIETSPGHAWQSESSGYFWRGFLANILNAKAALFYVLILPGFLDPNRGSTAGQALTLGLIHLAVSVAVHIGIVGLGARLGSRALTFAGEERLLLVRRVMAIGIAAVAVWLAVEGRPGAA